MNIDGHLLSNLLKVQPEYKVSIKTGNKCLVSRLLVPEASVVARLSLTALLPPAVLGSMLVEAEVVIVTVHVVEATRERRGLQVWL